jgi:hypothetical protein
MCSKNRWPIFSTMNSSVSLPAAVLQSEVLQSEGLHTGVASQAAAATALGHRNGLGWALLLPEYASFAACCSDGSTPSPSRTCGAAFTIQLQRSTVVSILSAAVQC